MRCMSIMINAVVKINVVGGKLPHRFDLMRPISLRDKRARSPGRIKNCD